MVAPLLAWLRAMAMLHTLDPVLQLPVVAMVVVTAMLLQLLSLVAMEMAMAILL